MSGAPGSAGLVGRPADEIDDRTTVHHDRDGRPDLTALGETLRERVRHRRERRIHVTLHLHAREVYPTGALGRTPGVGALSE